MARPRRFRCFHPGRAIMGISVLCVQVGMWAAASVRLPARGSWIRGAGPKFVTPGYCDMFSALTSSVDPICRFSYPERSCRVAEVSWFSDVW
ncbi:hypothetical protein GGR53DRAFT_477780 [Hypoxylon sp. FL1150]|nr:hypothetical protein GGR53DRAFT_477780 [Hypoxylon sp. FL1150]